MLGISIKAYQAAVTLFKSGCDDYKKIIWMAAKYEPTYVGLNKEGKQAVWEARFNWLTECLDAYVSMLNASYAYLGASLGYTDYCRAANSVLYWVAGCESYMIPMNIYNPSETGAKLWAVREGSDVFGCKVMNAQAKALGRSNVWLNGTKLSID